MPKTTLYGTLTNDRETNQLIYSSDKSEFPVADVYDEAVGERLAACWNACHGIENPEEAIREARGALDKALDMMAMTRDEGGGVWKQVKRARAKLGEGK